MSNFEEPNANSTMIEPGLCSKTDPRGSSSNDNSAVQMNSARSCVSRNTTQSECLSSDCSGHSVGHPCHIPRIPPSPTTYTLPSVLNKSIGTMHGGKQNDNLFGMIKLRENDVCYTSGTIEWVGRKRSFPINSGFKIMDEQCYTKVKKLKKLNTTFTRDMHRGTDCDCADVLPTVNAIVDHLNSLHEAVDLVDLRLNTLEDVMSKEKEGK